MERNDDLFANILKSNIEVKLPESLNFSIMENIQKLEAEKKRKAERRFVMKLIAFVFTPLVCITALILMFPEESVGMAGQGSSFISTFISSVFIILAKLYNVIMFSDYMNIVIAGFAGLTIYASGYVKQIIHYRNI